MCTHLLHTVALGTLLLAGPLYAQGAASPSDEQAAVQTIRALLQDLVPGP